MKIVDWPQFLQEKRVLQESLAVTIGVFDGVHKGHQALIEAIKRDRSLIPCVCTFTGNPMLIFSPNHYLGDIVTVPQKITLFRELGIQLLILIDFSHDFSKLSGRAFLSMLMEENKLSYLALGENFRFGYRADTSSFNAKEILSALGISVDIIPPVTYEKEPISSTRIRKAVAKGSFRDVENMMGRPFMLDVNHFSQGQEKGRMTIPLEQIRQVLPPAGEYNCIGIYEKKRENIAVSITEKHIEWTQHKDKHIKSIVFPRG